MKIVRKKIGDRSYNLVDKDTGVVIAHAAQTGEHGRDNYPWEWSLEEGLVFGKLGARTQSSASTLAESVDYVESTARDFGILREQGQVSGYDIKEGDVFRMMANGLYYFYRATQDAYGEFNAYIPCNDSRGELSEVLVPHGSTVTLYK